jgi:YjjG family noncanonical pyrimidine nucleotidase
MQEMKYRFILFDADNTLFDFSRSEAEALEKTFLSFGFPDYDAEVHLPLYLEINKEIWRELELGEIDQKNLKSERYRRFFKILRLELSPEEFGDRYLINLSQSVYLIEGAEELLDYLAEGSRTLSLVTNGISMVQKPRIENSGIADRFQSILISEEVGTAKPQKDFFDIAFRRCGSPDRAESLIIGDNLSSDILGGNYYGIDTCWFNPHDLPLHGEVVPTYTITRLEELKALL